MLKALRDLTNEFYGDYRSKLGYCHETAQIVKPMKIVGPQNVYMEEGSCVRRSKIYTPFRKLVIKKNSCLSGSCTVLTGNHMRVIGRFYRSIKQSEKAADFDKDVIVEEDCWVGENVTLLQGVTVRRGTTVAAGAVVNKSTVPYSVYGGVPAKLIKVYWTIDQILEHEKQLYPEEQRYTREQLEEFYRGLKKD